MSGPINPECDAVHAQKYRGEGENFREAMNRVAASLQDDHDHYQAFRRILMDMRFMPAGRIQAAMGSLKSVTPYNCFVMPTIHDSFVDGPSREELEELSSWEHPPMSIMRVGEAAAASMRQGGGVGYDISTLRPRGDLIRGVQSTTDGPMAFAPIYDAVCQATASAGNRRGAQMLVMRCDHPDIEYFIRAKQATGDLEILWRHLQAQPESREKQSMLKALRGTMPLRGFNMSVAVTDELMEAVQADTTFSLKFGGEKYREVAARDLWDMIMRSTYDWAEPGVLFIDTINRMNNLWYCEKISATNPCGEQPLPPYGACLLGSFVVTKYLVWNDGVWAFDWDKFENDIPEVVRAMDNVIDRARYPLPQQKNEAQMKRRIGIGVTGMANAVEAMGHPYGTPEYVKTQGQILSFMTRHIYLASVTLAKKKGAFPLFDEDLYIQGEFIQTLDDDVRQEIAKHGIRNALLTSIAPTGTISFCADNSSSGIEPIFGYEQQRRVKMKEGEITVSVSDYGVKHLGVMGRRASDLTAHEHVAVLCGAQKHVDSAVSKTCNVPTNMSYEDFSNLYFMAYEGGAKGCTTYRPNGNYEDVVKSVDTEAAVCRIDPETGQRVGACSE